jgi:hypothetical protein
MWADENTEHEKGGVTGVAGVTPYSHKGFSETPEKIEGVAGVAKPHDSLFAATPATPAEKEGVSPKAAPLLAATPETPATPEKQQSVISGEGNIIEGEI